ncbi:MAG: methyltransferase domain-containing protein [Turicibacter sp.]|nr:methyltransferase domain-containing protein [Turicibacter sp.]
MDKKALELQRIYWDTQHKSYERKSIKVDGWLKDSEVIQNCQTPIIDLGCGSGNNIVRLLKLGKTVIPCDYSENAIANIRRNFPEINQAECFDMAKGLPFEDSFTDVIIADLSLHYFSEAVTFEILREIKRVLKPCGTLLFRVNSMSDTNYGAGVGEEVEHHYYFTGTSSYKRFFDEKDIHYFLADWEVEFLTEIDLFRYDLPKKVWHGIARRASND